MVSRYNPGEEGAMTLVDRVSEDLKTAMKERDADKTKALRMIRAAFIEAAKSGEGEVTDARAIDAMRKIRKQRVEAAEQYRAGGRPELAADEEKEIVIIDAYLPKQADEAAVRGWVQEAIAALGAKSSKEAGKVVGAVMKAHKGDCEPAAVKAIAEAILPKE
jgi:uncharacterized protein YqeY